MKRLAAATAALVMCALALSACASDGSNTSTPTLPAPTADDTPRTFEMGLSSLPSRLTEASYEDAFERAGRAGDLVLIQRTPPWAEMISGDLSDETVAATQREVDLAHDQGLDIFFAIDPTEEIEGSSQLAGLPEFLRGAAFDNLQVQNAFIAYAEYVAQNYRPKYLALGVEVNSYQQQHPEDFERFVIVYHRAYDAVKALSPDTLVFPTFQFEELQGLLPVSDPRQPQWNLVSRFEPRLDMVAVSSFPNLVYEDPQLIPPSYYAQIPSYTDHPIALSALGYASEPAPGGSASGATEEKQAQFLQRTLDTAAQLQFQTIVWFVGQDPTFESDAGFEAFRRTGLARENGTDKPAWAVWAAMAARPLRPLEEPTPIP
jgi:hypothetical protein